MTRGSLLICQLDVFGRAKGKLLIEEEKRSCGVRDYTDTYL